MTDSRCCFCSAPLGPLNVTWGEQASRPGVPGRACYAPACAAQWVAAVLAWDEKQAQGTQLALFDRSAA